MGIPVTPPRELQHPSAFPNTLRRDNHKASMNSLRRDTPSPTPRFHTNRYSMGSYSNLINSSVNAVNYQRPDSAASNSIRDTKRDYVGSTSSLSKKNSIEHKSSVDSLDSWRYSWNTDRKNSLSSTLEDPLMEENPRNSYKVL